MFRLQAYRNRGPDGIATAAMFCINEAWFDALVHGKSSYMNLHWLITNNYVDLRVIAVWCLPMFDDPKVLKQFGFCAWIRVDASFQSTRVSPELDKIILKLEQDTLIRTGVALH